MPYADELRKIRQFMYRFFQRSTVKDHLDVQTQSTHKLLFRLLKTPDGFRGHIRQCVYFSSLFVTI